MVERAIDDGKQPAPPAEPEPTHPELDKEDGGAPADSGAPTQEGQDDEAQLLAEPTDDELRRYKPSTRRRIQALHRKAKDMEARVREMEPMAKAGRQIDDHLKANAVSVDQTLTAIDAVSAWNRGDLEGFERVAGPIIEAYLQMRGQKLPEDVQQRLNDGFIDEESARELARHRAVTDQQAQYRENLAREREEQTRREFVAGARTAVEGWEAQIRARDPDYDAKVPMIEDRINALIAREGLPSNHEGSVDLARRAYADVTKQLAHMRPVRPTSPTLNGFGHVAAHATPRPNSMQDAILSGLG